MRSWRPLCSGGEGRDFTFRGEALTRTVIRRSQVRVCPACLADDMRRWPALGPAAPFGRYEWQLAPLRTCPVHGQPLVEATNGYAATVHDFSRQLQPVLDQLINHADEGSRRQPSRLETYLRARLTGVARTATAWLDALPFHAAARLGEVVGAVAVHGPQVRINALTDDEWWAVSDAGYDIVAEGPTGIRALLDRLAASFWSRKGGTGPKALFGRLYEWLAHETDDPAYEPVREVIRQHVMETMPVGPGDEIFGHPVTDRRLWSIHAASLETGAHPKRLRKLLAAGGFIAEDGERQTDDRVVFPADNAASEFLVRVAGAMTLKEAGTYLNAPRVQMRLLLDSGFVRPFVRGGDDIIKDHAFARCDLDAFLGRLRADATEASTADGDLIDIPTGARQARCSAADIVGLLLDRKLTRVRKCQDVSGYMSVLVDPAEIRAQVHRESGSGLSLKQVELKMGWSQDVVRALVEKGHLPSQVVRNPINRLLQRVVSPQDLDAFAASFVSLHGLARERGVHFRRLKMDLETAGTRPALNPAEVSATFYTRADLLPA